MLKILQHGLLRCSALRHHRAKPPFAPRKPREGFVKLCGIEVGPQGVGEIKLSVGQLPQHEVADARLAARADEQVGLGLACGAKVVAELLGRQVSHGCRGVGGLPSLRSVQDVPTAAVVGRHVEGEAGVAGGVGHGFANAVLQGLREARNVADDVEAHAFGLHVFDFFFKVLNEQAHEGGHLVVGTAPVFGAEGEQGEVADAFFQAVFHQVWHQTRAFDMAHGARHEALFGPTAIAIHDDGNVSWTCSAFVHDSIL